MANLNVQEVEKLNRVASQKNAERQQLIGKREAAQQSFNQAIKAYEAKYGVALTAETLQEEYNRVQSETEKSYKALSDMIQKIENGTYNETSEEQAKVEDTAVPQSTVVPNTATVEQGTVVPNTATVKQSTVVPNTATFGQNTQPVPNVAPVQTTQPTQSAGGFSITPPKFGNPDEDISEQPVTPPAWGSDKINQEFSSILGEDANATKFNI